VTRSGRFTTVAPLPPHGEWRRSLALDREGSAPRPVVLAFVPPPVLDDPARLAALVRDVEAAGRLDHPCAVPVRGTETVDDALAVVEDYRPGTTVRALLDAGGRFPPDVAARIALDLCGALAQAHAIDAGDGRRLAHGAISAERIALADDGAALLSGFGEAAGGDPAADLRAAAAVLHECLAGEPPGAAPRPLDAPGVPAALVAAVDRALGAAPGAPFASAAALAESLAAAGPVASQADVAAYAEAILPAEEGGRDALRQALERAAAEGAEEVSDEYLVEPTDPAQLAPGAAELPRPPQTRPGVDTAGVFRAPGPPRERSAVPLVLAVAAGCAAAGFGIGFALSRAGHEAPAPVAAAPEAPAPAAVPPAAAAAAASPAPSPAPPPGPTPASAREEKAARPAKGSARPAGKAVSQRAAPAGKGSLKVTAPPEAEVVLDGRRIGKGSLTVEVPAGAHRIEVRLGEARASERFSVVPGQTWTYDVTPTPPPAP